jgi:uncharacterized repeat protein (TIGR03803 family)
MDRTGSLLFSRWQRRQLPLGGGSLGRGWKHLRHHQPGGLSNLGTVFELVPPVGKGTYTEKVLWSFNGTDGNGPLSSLVLDGAGNLYGTTASGGANGEGVVFEVTP